MHRLPRLHRMSQQLVVLVLLVWTTYRFERCVRLFVKMTKLLARSLLHETKFRFSTSRDQTPEEAENFRNWQYQHIACYLID